MQRSIRRVLLVVAGLLGAIILVSLAFVVGCSNSYWWDRDQWNQEKLAKAYVSFYSDHTNFPNGLADLVEHGYLPEKAEWYKEPPGFFAHPIDFHESSYVVRPPTSSNVENLRMIGRKVSHGGKEEIDFSSPQNAFIRDEIKRLAPSASLR